VPPDNGSAPRTSVVIPTRNYGRFLGEAIQSVLTQEPGDLEVLVVDDNSTDETPEVLAAISDPRVRSLRIAADNTSEARNAGMDLARGEYLAFLDADDRWAQGKLMRQLAILEREPAVSMVFTDFLRFNERGYYSSTQFDLIPTLRTVPSRPTVGGGKVLLEPAFATLVGMPHFATWVQTVVLRRAAIGDLRFSPRIGLSQDMHFMYRVYPRVAAAFIDEPLVEVRRHGGNSYTSLLPKLIVEPEILARLLKEDFSAGDREVLRRKLGSAWASLGYHYFYAGPSSKAAAAYLRALAYPGRRLASLKHLLTLPLAAWLRDEASGDHFPPSSW